MTEAVPRIVLPAMEFPSQKKSSIRQLRVKARPVAELNHSLTDAPMKGLLLAIEDMRVLVGHVTNLLDNEYTAEAGISAWLTHLYEVVGDIGASIRQGKITSGCRLTIDDEATADLENALALGWYAEDQEWTDTAQSALLAKLIEYWIEQIKARGLSLLHLLIGADDVIGAGRSLTKLKEVRYPLPLTVK